jgi:hypothetical protein
MHHHKDSEICLSKVNERDSVFYTALSAFCLILDSRKKIRFPIGLSNRTEWCCYRNFSRNNKLLSTLESLSMKLDYLVTRGNWQVSEAALGLVLKLDWVGRLPLVLSQRHLAVGCRFAPLLDG